MEQIISELVQAFEHGRMTRRQLIKNLALTATAASVAGAVPVGAAESKLIKAVGIDHISIQCKDYTKERDFYTGLLGLQASNDNGKSCNILIGKTALVLRNVGVRSTAISDKIEHGSDVPGVDHISYVLADWDKDKKIEEAMRAELKHRGLVTGQGARGHFHVADPDGLGVQIGPEDLGKPPKK